MTNIVVIKGNIVRDPLLREVGANNTPVTNFDVAVNRFYTDGNGNKQQEVCYVPCEAWGSGAKTITDLFKKGDPILIEGSMKQDNYEKDGQKVYKLKVRLNRFDRIPRYSKNNSSEAGGSSESDGATEAAAADAGGDGSDIPF